MNPVVTAYDSIRSTDLDTAFESGADVFLDTSVLIPATVEVHPSHEAAADTIHRLMSQDARSFISPQVCREFLVVLTRQPIRGRRIDLDEALEISLIAIDG